MTLEEYKQQVKEINEANQNFKGTQEETVKFFEDLAKKYPQVNEFNTKAMDCKDLKEFKKLADSFGMKFNSDESAEKLFSMLQEGKKQLEAMTLKYKNGAELSDDDLDAVSGGSPANAAFLGVLGGVIGGVIAGPAGFFVGVTVGVGGGAFI